MSHKLGICIPYRNRKEHIERLIPHLSKHLTEKGIDHSFYVGHQVDDKLFNRGAMKNIAAHIAFEDGCDYIAWHDVDMLPLDLDCDYSYPEEVPIHIATKLSKYGYSMGYEQYFGGVIIFTKDQVEKTNGYSNDYWDWGQEDDDLFWRCYYEGYTDNTILETIKNKSIGVFNGSDSQLVFPTNREISSTLFRDHTISILVKSEQQPEKIPIWLVGDKERKFMEFPILRKYGAWTWGISFNNSRAYSVLYFDRQSNPIYNWAKRSEGQWARFVISYKEERDELYVYMNGQLVSNIGDVLRNKPIIIPNKLKSVDSVKPFIMGHCPQTNTYFKGMIGDIKIYNRCFENYDDINDDSLVFEYDFNPRTEHEIKNVTFIEDEVIIQKNVLPHRREGKFFCLPHEDLGFVNGTWKQGETTARNEKRFVTEMQQKKIDYKVEGINKIIDVLDIINIDESIYPNTKFINVEMK